MTRNFTITKVELSVTGTLYVLVTVRHIPLGSLTVTGQQSTTGYNNFCTILLGVK